MEPVLEQKREHSGELKGLRGTPSLWLQRFVRLFKPTSRVLDLACGAGRNSGYLASWGHQVTGVDIDPRCREHIEVIPNATFLQADLEGGSWPFMAEQFDVVVVNFYLFRPLFPKLVEVLSPGGYLVYETFCQPYEGFVGSHLRSSRVVLQPGELLSAFGTKLTLLAYERTLSEKNDCFEHILAMKPDPLHPYQPRLPVS